MNMGPWDTWEYFNFGSEGKKTNIYGPLFYAMFITLGGGGACREETSVKPSKPFLCIYDMLVCL